MEGPACRARQPPVARFNTFEEAETEIKAQIQNASRTQKALRARSSLGQTKALPEEAADGLQPAAVAITKPNGLDCSTRPESVSALADLERHSLDRTFSFNSLSTLQRGAEAARLSQWRDSPVSAFSPTDRTALPNTETNLETQEPYVPITVYKLKQSRKDEKEYRRSIKKQEKVQKKADKAAAHKRRHSMATDAVTSGGQDVKPANTSDGSAAPRRAISDPSFKAHKDAAVQLVKKLTAKPMNKLSRRGKPQLQPEPVPHVDDFISKPDLHEYLNSSLPEPNLPIAELPGPLPPYTPFQNSMANADNAVVSDATIAGRPSVRRALSANGGLEHESSQPRRMMRCDVCQFGIKVDEPYLQCSICDNGDRIICSSCDSAGESCRHELTRRHRQVLGYSDASQQTGSSRTNTHRRHDVPPRSSTFGTTEEMLKPSNVSHSYHYSDTHTSHRSKSATYELQERRHLLDLRDLDIRKREQDLVHREREAVLRQREAALRERQVKLENREAEAAIKAQQHEKNACTRDHFARDHFARQCSEMATFLGSQFACLQTQLSEISRSMPKSTNSSDAEDNIDLSDETFFRSHAGKRKAPGKPRTTSSNSTGRPTHSSLKPVFRGDLDSPDEDDEDGDSGTPKKIKQDPDDATSPGKLYACHFCKYDGSRYSERNSSEKQYRGCSSGYWPDISRLKQHLYRVHWRNHHCHQCFAMFKKSSDLQAHIRMRSCQTSECPYPEKIEHEKYNEIRKKRPANTPEEVWYIIYDILFPGEPHPATPYADSADAQRQPSFSSPNMPAAQQTWAALDNAFESRLDHHQDSPTQPWLRMPEVRNFIREQLRASMADVLRQMTPAATPATTPISGERSPRSATEQDPTRRLSIPGPGSSMPTSPAPLSATSTGSTSSVQWRLPNHRRSFSRPLLPQNVAMSSKQQSNRPALTLDTVTTPSEITFAVATPGNPEDDQYDSESGSWHQNDDSLGLAISTDPFNFEFQHTPSALTPQPVLAAGGQGSLPPKHSERTLQFRPVKVSSLDDVDANNTTSTSKPALIIDSAYGSLESNHGNPRPSRHHVKATVGTVDCDLDMPVPEHELNMDALKIPFQDFLGAEMDECGNIGGRSLTEYLYG